tara:strand:+ start:69 stop:311 length:243 start_codon:yes stop_codon:yes gene_type:complete
MDPTAAWELNAVKDADDVSFRKKAEITGVRDKIRLHYRDRGHATPFLLNSSLLSLLLKSRSLQELHSVVDAAPCAMKPER